MATGGKVRTGGDVVEVLAPRTEMERADTLRFKALIGQVFPHVPRRQELLCHCLQETRNPGPMGT